MGLVLVEAVGEPLVAYREGRMNLYNPLSPHIVEWCDGSYSVRKLSIFGWIYYGSVSCTEWANRKSVLSYCKVGTIEEAENLLKRVSGRVVKKH